MKHIITIAIIAVTTTASDAQAQSGILGGLQQIVGNFGYSSSSNACARRSSAACSQRAYQSACGQRAQSACSQQQAYQSACSQRAMSACSVQSACAQRAVAPSCAVQPACSVAPAVQQACQTEANDPNQNGKVRESAPYVATGVGQYGSTVRRVPQPRPVPQTVVKQRQPVRQSTRGGGGFTG